MVKYDSKIIYKFANHLYRQALWAIVVSTILGIIFGAIAGLLSGLGILGLANQNLDEGASQVAIAVAVTLALTIVGAAVFGLLGFSGGRDRAFRLRLQAQTALCQVKIEENTRSES